MQKTQEDLGKEIKQALQDSQVPKFYANGFTTTLGAGDITILLKQVENNVGVLSLSYTVAKTLAIKLGEIVSRLEQLTKNTIMTTDQVVLAIDQGLNK